MVDAGVQLYRIRITSSAVAECVGRRPLVSISRAEVRKLRIQRGLITERPWILAGVGLCITAIGIAGLAHTVLTFLGKMDGRLLPARLISMSLVALVFGPVALYFSFRRGLTLLVDTASSTRKLGFGAQVTSAELNNFVDAARASGITVEVSADLPHAKLVASRS
ncbi:MAG TPA: hypothetical protein VH165_24975 [Kofleriaceae bacterium]|jgi:hypothetical protein|nr:hypothetical protein [Kofleriaceae bacterium]